MENWQIEMQHLLEMFERESTISLRKINRYLVASGQPFGENFRKYFLKMSNFRLDSSFNVVLFEHENRMGMTPSASTLSMNGNRSTQNPGILNFTRDQFGTINATADENVLGLKVENDVGALIEIVDSSDDEDVVVEQKYLISSAENRSNAPKASAGETVTVSVLVSTIQNSLEAPIEIVNSADEGDGVESRMQSFTNTNGKQIQSNESLELTQDTSNSNEENVNDDLNNEDDTGVDVKLELKTESPNETMHLPIVEFNPNAENDGFYVKDSDTVAELLYNQNQPSTSSNTGMQSERGNDKRFKCNKCAYTTHYKCNLKSHRRIHDSSTVKPFKCEDCSYASRYKQDLKRHQKIHAHQKLIGIDCHSNDGLHKCTHCNRQFAKWHGLRIHLSQSHKNNQRLFNCERCMRQFTQKIKKETHELRCENRRYECHLCKKYVTRSVSDMQDHMRTHSGAKPFECAICNKCFRLKGALNCHLKRLHGHMST